jgi:hypothetical protein
MNALASLFTGEDGRLWYDLVTALRGPDFPNMGVVKDILIARLRYLALTNGGVEPLPDGINFPGDLRYDKTVSKADVDEAFEQMRNDDPPATHFFGHFQRALEALRLFGYVSEEEYAFLFAFHSSFGWPTVRKTAAELADDLAARFPEFVK